MRPAFANAFTVITSLITLTLASPAVASITPATGNGGAASWEPGQVVINEFAPSDPVGQFDEFVELRNTSNQVVALGGWELRACLSPTSVKLAAVFPFGTTIPPGGHYLLTRPGWAGASPPGGRYDVVMPDDGGWLLFDPWIGYTDGVGLSNDLACTEGDPAPQCDWSAGEAVIRDAFGMDTDDNLADFACTAGTPGF